MYEPLVVFGAEYLVWIIAAVALGYLCVTREWRGFAILSASSLALAFAAGKALGLLWYNPLPFVVTGAAPLIAHAANNGFPSDHMLLGATLASATLAYNRGLGALLWLLALLVGASRVLAGVHHGVDITAAAAVAALSTLAVELLRRRLL